MKKIVFVAIILFLSTSAISQKTIEGCVTVSVRMYDSLKGYFSPALYFNNKILIYKNYAIREFNTHFYEEDSLGKVVKNKLILTNYIFIDIKKNAFLNILHNFLLKLHFQIHLLTMIQYPKVMLVICFGLQMIRLDKLEFLKQLISKLVILLLML